MVKTYKRTSSRGGWSEEDMKNAVDSVVEERMGYYLASNTFSIPQSTLERKVQAARNISNNNDSTKLKIQLGPKQQVFSEEEENELCNYILNMESRLYGLTTKDLKSLVFKVAVKNNKPHPFNDDKQEAGRDWVKNFLNRHPELSIRKPESTSAARAAGFNKQAVDKYFDFLANVYDKHQMTPDRIYNCDETGISIVPKTKSKIIAKKGQKQVGAITSAERGATITVEICFSASGQYMPPMMIFPRKRMDPQLMLNAAPGAWGVCSDSGWMTAELFLEWFKKFIQFSGATPKRNVLLLLDGHSSHTKNIDLINEARSHGVIILCFPPHTTHRLQVADVVYMRPLSTYYDQQIPTWLRNNPGMVVTVRQLAEIFGKAFIQASTMLTAVNGFKKCGIFPYDPSVFSEIDFAASLTTEIPQTERVLNSGVPIASTGMPNSELATTVVSVNSQTLAAGFIGAQPNIQTAPDYPEASPLANSTATIPETHPARFPSAEIEPTYILDVSPASSALTISMNPVKLIPAEVKVETISTSIAVTAPILLTTNSDPEPGCSSWSDGIEIDKKSCITQTSTFPVISPEQVLPFPVTRKTSSVAKKRGKTAIITDSPYKNELEETIKKRKLLEENKQMRREIRELKKAKQSEIKKKKSSQKEKSI